MFDNRASMATISGGHTGETTALNAFVNLPAAGPPPARRPTYPAAEIGALDLPDDPRRFEGAARGAETARPAVPLGARQPRADCEPSPRTGCERSGTHGAARTTPVRPLSLTGAYSALVQLRNSDGVCK